MAITEDFLPLVGRNDERLVVPSKDATININIPILQWSSNGFYLALDALFNRGQDYPAVTSGEVTESTLLLYENAPSYSAILSFM